MDNVEVFYAGQTCGTIPYTSLPAFHLFCKQSGFQLQWDERQRRIFLDSGLKGKTCVLVCGSQLIPAASNFTPHERDVLVWTKRFLADVGVNVVLSPDQGGLPEQRDVSVQFIIEKADLEDQPRITIIQDMSPRNQTLVRCLATEWKSAGIPCASELCSESRRLHPFVEVRCQLPINVEQTAWKEWAERIALSFATGILRYLQTDQQISPISCLPLPVLQVLAAGMIFRQQETLTHGWLEKRTSITDRPESTQEKVPEARLVRGEEGASQPAVGETSAEVSRLKERGDLAAEVFFDYTVLRSDIEGKPFLIFGNLYVKNTGTEPLINPVVCLRADPPDSVKLGGQILPANMVETLGVQSPAGVKGWRYLEEDWFEQAKERGEYWMAPIHPVRIAPGEVQPFQNFQITVMKPKSGNSVMIEGFVYFHDQNVQFISNNRISLSC